MKTIPDGCNAVMPYIVIDDAAAAIEFYTKALGAKQGMSLPNPTGKGIMYAEIQIGTSRIMLGEPCPQYSGKSAKTLGGSPISFYVYVEDVEAAFKKAKDAGMTVEKDIKDMFWGDRMGTLNDKFNMQWTLAQHVKDVSPAQMQAAMKAMA
ncbi:MAG: glyoxalase [Thiotrichales bacterium]|nr:MAG: glyoxalase [Thiotrichales bacterium]